MSPARLDSRAHTPMMESPKQWINVIHILLAVVSLAPLHIKGQDCTEGDVRLVGGANETEGTVEVCLYGQWGTVCDDYWGVTDATVVCRQLGFSTDVVLAPGSAFFGPGSGPINMDNVLCEGIESFLTNCSYTIEYKCLHIHDAGVICRQAECSEGDVRLTNGNSSTEGFVEVCYNGLWGTVCDDYWSTNDAKVVCRQLGYNANNAVALYNRQYFDQGTGPININEVQCKGTERKLLECPFNPPNNCFHMKDAGVACPDPPIGPCGMAGFTGCCNANTESDCFGETQNCYCDLTCYEFADCCSDIGAIGCKPIDPTPTPNPGSCVAKGYDGCCNTTISPLCFGNDGICFCDQSCYHYADCCPDIDSIGCYASTSIPTSTSQSIRKSTVSTSVNIISSTPPVLVTSTTHMSSTSSSLMTSSGSVSSPAVSSTSCSTLVQSSHISFLPSPSTTRPPMPSSTSRVRFTSTPSPTTIPGLVQSLSIKTINQSSVLITWMQPLNGSNIIGNYYVVVQKYGEDNPDDNSQLYSVLPTRALQVTAQELLPRVPYFVSIEAMNSYGFGPVLTKIIFTIEGVPQSAPSDLSLKRINATALNVSWIPLSLTQAQGFILFYQIVYEPTVNTGHAMTLSVPSDNSYIIIADLTVGNTYRVEIRAVTREGIGPEAIVTEPAVCTYGSVRLVGGPTSNQGRLEICINNVWGTVCDDEWTNTNARVVCRQLGYSTTGAIYAYYGTGNGSILLYNVQCTGNESSLLSCTHNTIGNNDCSHSEDVGVSCLRDVSSCTNGSLRLVGGHSGSHEGRVEVCIDGVWGTVCDDYFGRQDAKVVCRQLGYPESGATAYSEAYFGPGNGSILLDNVMCSGSESRLVDCNHNGIGNNYCSHSEDVGVTCPAPHISTALAVIILGSSFIFIVLTLTIIVLVIVCCYKRRKRTHHRYTVIGGTPSVPNYQDTLRDTSPPTQLSHGANEPPPSYSEAIHCKNYELQQLPLIQNEDILMSQPHPSRQTN